MRETYVYAVPRPIAPDWVRWLHADPGIVLDGDVSRLHLRPVGPVPPQLRALLGLGEQPPPERSTGLLAVSRPVALF